MVKVINLISSLLLKKAYQHRLLLLSRSSIYVQLLGEKKSASTITFVQYQQLSSNLLNMHVTRMSNIIKIIVSIAILFTIALCFCLLTMFQLNYVNAFTDKGKPHIIVIIADDMGWNDVSFHGSNEIPTPNIDSLAYNGVILNNHYTLPICTPSRTAFFTGRYPIRAGMQGFPLMAGEARGIPLSTRLLPEYLRKLGYVTRLVGKWHLGYQSDEFTPAKRGFDTFFGYYSGYITYFNHTITQSGQTGYDLHRDTPMSLKPALPNENKYATDIFTDEAIKIINEHNDDKHPLYLQIAHVAPHASDAEETLETRDLSQVNKTFYYIQDLKRRKYAGMVSAMDESVGRVMKALSSKNLLDNSIIIFMSDNGAQTFGIHENHGSNYPLRGLKLTLYEGGVHGVACIYSPLIRNRGRIVNDLVHITDWLPTLYAAAGGSVVDLGTIDGVNQWPTISQGEYGRRESLLVNIDEAEHVEAAIMGQYKLLKSAIPLYDGYFGSNGNESDPYNIDVVRLSQTSLAIADATKTLVTPSKMLQLRARSKITCKPFTEFANCSNGCLFDLDVDPCETTNISMQHPDVLKRLEDFIDGYRSVLMNQTNVPVDPRSFPQYFNGTWMPWLNTQ